MEGTKRKALAAGIGHALEPPGVRLRRAFLGCRSERVWCCGICVEHQLPIAGYIRSDERLDVHVGELASKHVVRDAYRCNDEQEEPDVAV